MLDDFSAQSYNEDEPNMWNGDEYTDDPIVADDSTLSTNDRSKRARRLVPVDKGYFCLKDKTKRHRIRIEGYSSSNTPGATIRNAVTGIYETNFINSTRHVVGSIDEDLYFKVIMVLDGPEPRTLFYENIDQYERHFNTTVNNDTARKWHEKNYAARQEYEKQLESPKNQYYYVK